MSNNPIVLKSNRLSDECIGTVRLTPEAEKVVRRLRAKTGLPIPWITLLCRSSLRVARWASMASSLPVSLITTKEQTA